MNYVDIFLLTMITVGYGNEQKASTVLSDESFNSSNHRNKSSDCWFYQWTFSTNCRNGCADHCLLDSYSSTFSTSCGTNVSLDCCIIRSQNTYQLSSNCPGLEQGGLKLSLLEELLHDLDTLEICTGAFNFVNIFFKAYGTYLDIACEQTVRPCGYGQTAYQCICSNGYLSPTTTTPSTTTTATPIIRILIGTIIPILMIVGVILVKLWYRVHSHRKAVELEKKIQAGIIPIKCNVMVIVDDLDEFKVYATRLMVSLQDRFPKLVCERLSTWNVLNDNYEITCDKLLVFRKKSNASLKGQVIDALSKKVHYRYDGHRSVVVECGETNVTKKAEVHTFVDEICLVPSMKHIGGWLPVVMRNLFDVKERCINIHNSTYFINSEQRTSNSEYCKEMRCTVENLLISFGATVAQSEHAAMCKLAFLDSIGDDLTLTNYFIFVSIGPMSDRNSRQYLDKNAFGRKDVILGIIRLLSKLNVISCKGMPNINPMRYNP